MTLFQVIIVKSQDQIDVDLPISYEEAQVWRVKLNNHNDHNGIKKLIHNQDISMWNLSPIQVDFLIQPYKKVKVNRALNSWGLNHSVLILDVQRRLDSLKVDAALWNEKTLRVGHRLNWNAFPTLTIINEYFTYLAENFPSICTLTTIGYTAQNNSIQMLKISNGNPSNNALLVLSGLHAREWLAITSALYILDNIVTKFDYLSNFLQEVDWLFIPVLNPDGYEYSHTNDRLWRKNRRILKKCVGVDINRNFNIDWNTPGIRIKKECHESYSGPHAFSEAESIALKNVVMNSKKKLNALIDLHSYGQLILFPWSAKPNPPCDLTLLQRSANAMIYAIKNATGQRYEAGMTYHKMYPATGSAIDWLYTLGVRRSFALETRDKGNHGFLMPPEYIEPAGKDMLAAVARLAKEVHREVVNRRISHTYSWF